MSLGAGSSVRYRHTQVGHVVLVAVAATSGLIGWLLWTASQPAIAVGVLAFLVVVVLVFGWLTFEIRGDDLRLSFGIGLVRRTIPLSDVADARVVRNRWWYGWGIRRIPRGWLYNVSGLDAVEIVLRGGGVLRIGTDEPAKLCRWIEAHAAR